METIIIIIIIIVIINDELFTRWKIIDNIYRLLKDTDFGVLKQFNYLYMYSKLLYKVEVVILCKEM